jgi:hypothetical protein
MSNDAGEVIRVGVLHKTCGTRFLVELRFGHFQVNPAESPLEEKALIMYHQSNSNHYIIKLDQCPQCGNWVEQDELKIIEIIKG